MGKAIRVIIILLDESNTVVLVAKLNSLGTRNIAWVVAAIILLLNLYLLYDAIK